jgi:error-prone DNA polymerase
LSEYERVRLDYDYMGFSLLMHPFSFIRIDLKKRDFISAHDIASLEHGKEVKVAGLVIIRQRPPTAKGVVFFTLEDETGLMNIVLWPSLAESHRQEVLLAQAVAIKGRLEKKMAAITLSPLISMIYP